MSMAPSWWTFISGRSSESVGDLNRGDQSTAVLAETKEKQWRQSRHLETSETTAPSMAGVPVPNVSYDSMSSSTTGEGLVPTPSPTAAPTIASTSPAVGVDDDDETPAPTNSTLSTLTPTPSPAYGNGGGDTPTPAPVRGTEVSLLTGFLGAPTTAFDSTSPSTFSDKLRDYLDLEDQDVLTFDSSRRRARRLNLPREIDYDGSKRRSHEVGLSGIRYDDRKRGYNTRSHRRLEEDYEETRGFEVAFVNDADEWTAFRRGGYATSLLLKNSEKIATALNTTEDTITFSDVYYITPEDADFTLSEVESTFFGEDSLITITAASVGIAFLVALIIITSCLGVVFCKCLLVEDRKRRIARSRLAKHREEQLQPAYERMPPDSPVLNTSMPPEPSASYSSSKGYSSLRSSGGSGLKGNGMRSITASGLGSSSSRQRGRDDGADVDIGAAAVPVDVVMTTDSGEQGPFLYEGSERSSGKAVAGGALGAAGACAGGGVAGGRRDRGGKVESSSRRSIGSSSGIDEGYEAGEELVEHDYGDSVQTESFVDVVDGVYSEYDGQSEYDPVVPGGTTTDGMLSEAGSSARFYYDETQMSEWSTDVSSQHDAGTFPGFPIRQGSARFSAGPRSQASFAAPSVAASGLSALSSVVPSSRTNIPPASVSPPFPGRRGVGFHVAEGVGASSANVTPAATPSGVEGGDIGDGDLVIGQEKIVIVGGRGSGAGAKQEQEEKRADEKGKGKEPGILELEKDAKIHAGEDDTGMEETGNNRCGSVTGTAIPVWPSAGSASAASGATARAIDASAASLLAGASDSDADVSSAQVSHPHPPAPSFSGSDEAGLPPGGNDEGGISPSSSLKGRPSLDSDAGSAAMSSVVAFSRRGAGAGSPPGSTVGVVEGDVASKAQGVVAYIGDGGGGGRVDGQDDDDAGSRYAGSSVANEPLRRQEIGGGVPGRDSASSRPTRVGGSTGTGEPMGRNSQSIGGMSAPESSHDSDRESFVSRVGSYAMTDIGVARGGQEGAGSQVGRVHGSGGLSPTSTVVRSTGMSELGTERDSYGSDIFTTGSDSPGAHSGWERAWMRQRDARHFDGR